MKYSALLAAVSIFAAAPAYSANWVEYGTTSTAVAKIDTNSISPMGNGWIKAWVMHTFASPQEATTYPKFSFQSAMQLEVYNCTERTTDFLQVVHYADENGQGAVVKTKTYPRSSLNFSDVVPGSIGESALDFACNWSKRKSKK